MSTIDFEALTKPLSADDPCGPDLDLNGDAAYMNYVAGAEGLLPKSYFGKDQAGNEGRPFDRTSINFEAQFNGANPFLEKTRDLRLLGLLSKFCILNRDLPGFIACTRSMGALLRTHWEHVHPRGEDGDFGLRMVAVESIDSLPTVVMPLQFLPLIEHQRLGSISYRGYMIAKGEGQPIAGEESMSLATVEKILEQASLQALIDRREQFQKVSSTLTEIRDVWQEHIGSGPMLSLDHLPKTVTQIFGLLDNEITRRDPGLSLSAATADATPHGAVGSVAPTGVPEATSRITSSMHVAGALAAVADYFSRCEPSSPALLLVRQAIELLGKSFLEVMQALVPDHVNTAVVKVGKEQFFSLPVERLSAFAGEGAAQKASASPSEPPSGTQFDVQSRREALELLEQVGNYFRKTEPSSPIPFLVDGARDFAQQDFLSVLSTLLPAGALGSMELQKK